MTRDPAVEYAERTARAVSGDEALFRFDAQLTDAQPQAFGRKVATEHWHIYSLLFPHLAGRTGYRVLELGSGYGRNAPFLTMFDCRGYVGIERDQARCEYAEWRYGGRFVSFRCGDLTAYRADRADVVVMVNVLQHMEQAEKRAAIETVVANLGDGGVGLLWDWEILGAGEGDPFPQASHMIPVDETDVATWCAPLALRREAQNFWTITRAMA